MRIAQVIPYRLHPYSGVLQAIVELTVALARLGADVEIWQLETWPDEVEDLAGTLDAANIRRVTVPMSKNYWHLGEAAKKFIAEQTVDIVHFHGAFSPMNNLVARELKVPYALSPHGGYARAVAERHRLRKMFFKRLFELPMIKGAAVLWALTEAEKEEILGFCGHSHVEVGPSGYEPAFQDADAMALRRELGIRADTLLAVFVGRLDIYYKRLDSLVKGLSGAPEWHLALVGPDWDHSIRRLERVIRREDLGGRVHLVRPRRGQALHEALAAANLFVLMSRSEGLPIALLAALSHGVPALISPSVERAVGVAAAGAGWACRPDDLAKTLGRLSRLDARKWEESRAAALRLSQQYGWESTLDPYLKVMTHMNSTHDACRQIESSAARN
jgi:glycosyltransferase involved in cell wall biosynthesis